MKKFLQLFFVLSFVLVSTAWAQDRVVSGKVTSSEDKSTLPGVNVVLKGTTNGTVTDTDGNYKLTIPGAGGTLVFSFIGMQTQEVAIGDRSIVDVTLGLDVTQLNEVVVVGYGTQNKRDLTGSIASVAGKDIAMMPIQSFDQALQGRAAGVNISTPNGVLNNPPVIRIRGVSSISLSSFPLVVVDGVPTYTGDISTTNAANNPLSNINPADIESVEVLKDASASAIYGSRAAAGVILITTKRGAKGRGKVSLDSWVGVTQPFRLFDMLNAQQYMDMKNEGVRNLNDNRFVATGTPGTNIQGFLPTLDANGKVIDTKWYDNVYQNGVSFSNNLSFSGGSDLTSYYISVGHTRQQGMIKKNSFERASVRINIDQKVFDWLSVGTNVNYSNNFNSAPNTGSLNGSAFATAGLGRLPLVLPPNIGPFKNDGTYSLSGAGIGPMGNIDPTTGAPLAPGYYNPNLILDKNTFTSEANQIQGSIFANFRIIKGLNFRTSYGIDRLSLEDITFQTGLGGDGFSTGGQAINTYATRNRWNMQNTLQYDFKVADKHNFSALVGAEEQRTQTTRWGANRTTLADSFFETFQGNYTNIAVANNAQTENYLVSYFTRFTYDFNKKYFASVNFRRDGYSAWANKYGNFYGAALGYTISEEEFWKSTSFLSAVSFFKLKASYGEVGNSNGINDFASLQLYASGLYALAPTLVYNQAGNTALAWEKAKKTDIGFSYGLLNDRIQGEFSYYQNQIDGLILDVQQAASKGIPGNTIPANVGQMTNSGIEFSVKFNAITKGSFNWTINANFTTLKNVVDKLNDPTVKIFTATSGLEQPSVTVQGQSVGSFLAVPTIGINPANGRRMFQKADGTVAQYDHNGTGWTNVATGLTTVAPSQLVDGVIMGPSLPTYYGGFDNTFRYKNWDFSVFLQFSGGNYVYNGTKAGLRDQRFWNNEVGIMDRWTPEHTNGSIPRLVYGDNVSNGSALVISENVEKGDFIRGRNISLGYTFPKGLLDKIKLSNARIYASVQNAFLITGYKGIDPENQANNNSTTAASVDRNSVGQARTYTVGINIGF